MSEVRITTWQNLTAGVYANNDLNGIGCCIHFIVSLTQLLCLWMVSVEEILESERK